MRATAAEPGYTAAAMSRRGDGDERSKGRDAKPKGGAGAGGRVVRRKATDRKRMPEDLEAFAGGDDDALWRRPAKARIRDPRPVQLVPGVANRDARAVYEHRARRLRALHEAGDEDALAVELAEAARMQVWRGRSVVGWDAFVEDVLGLTREQAEALALRGAETVGSREPASEEVVAAWMRAEAGAIEGCGPDAIVRLRKDRLVIDLPIDQANTALSAIGFRATPLAREQAEAPKTVVDRPKGVPRISRLERDMRRDDD